jgi:hypothetical protein
MLPQRHRSNALITYSPGQWPLHCHSPTHAKSSNKAPKLQHLPGKAMLRLAAGLDNPSGIGVFGVFPANKNPDDAGIPHENSGFGSISVGSGLFVFFSSLGISRLDLGGGCGISARIWKCLSTPGRRSL